MQQIIPRKRLLKEIKQGLTESPITALLGSRQVGKTTLAREISKMFNNIQFFDLETAAGKASLSHSPEQILRGSSDLAVIDEIQRIPSLFETLRPIADDLSGKKSFLILGSASPNLIQGISESLAGRVSFISVPGFHLEEVGTEYQNRLWFRGGFPPAFLKSTDEAANRWVENFRITFLERDIPNLGLKIPSTALDRFWNMMAHYHGQIWNASELAKSMDVSPNTVNRYRDILAGTFILRILPPWYENMGKRQIKSPKVYFRDSGLLHSLLSITSQQVLFAHPKYGSSFEGFALEQLLIINGQRDAYFWATQRGAELDLLLFRNGLRWGFEFKCSDAPSTSRSMHIAIKDLKLEKLYVIYPGAERYPLGEKIEAVPLKEAYKLSLLKE